MIFWQTFSHLLKMEMILYSNYKDYICVFNSYYGNYSCFRQEKLFSYYKIEEY